MNPLRVTREMRADVYDTLELVAEMAGGVRSETFTTDGGNTPCCLHGMAAFAFDGPEFHGPRPGNPLSAALKKVGITYDENDRAVRKVQKALGLPELWSQPVPFRALMRELNVVRVAF